jgi:LPS-assembly lipoprotein
MDLARRQGIFGALALLALALASGCGFRLRGAVDVPPDLSPIYVDAPSGSLVREAMEEQLRGGPVALADKAADAKLIVRLQGESRSSRVVATDSSGKVLAYDLYFKLTYEATTANGERKLSPQPLDLVRTFDNPDVEVLGKQLEEEQIYRELAVDAADRILMRLRTLLR